MVGKGTPYIPPLGQCSAPWPRKPGEIKYIPSLSQRVESALKVAPPFGVILTQKNLRDGNKIGENIYYFWNNLIYTEGKDLSCALAIHIARAGEDPSANFRFGFLPFLHSTQVAYLLAFIFSGQDDVVGWDCEKYEAPLLWRHPETEISEAWVWGELEYILCLALLSYTEGKDLSHALAYVFARGWEDPSPIFRSYVQLFQKSHNRLKFNHYGFSVRMT